MPAGGADVVARLRRAHDEAGAGRLADAARTLDDLLRLAPDHRDAHNHAGVVAHRSGPVGRAVDEQPVAQGHAAEPELALCDRTQRSLLGRSTKKDAAKPRSRTSIRSSLEWMSDQAS